MRFLVDEMFSPEAARHLSDLGHDVRHVRDIGRAGPTDEEVLDQAAAEDRVVVTENAVDFVPLLDAAVGVVPPPVVLAPTAPFRPTPAPWRASWPADWPAGPTAILTRTAVHWLA